MPREHRVHWQLRRIQQQQQRQQLRDRVLQVRQGWPHRTFVPRSPGHQQQRRWVWRCQWWVPELQRRPVPHLVSAPFVSVQRWLLMSAFSYTCGGVGHLSRDCVQGSKCYNCSGFVSLFTYDQGCAPGFTWDHRATSRRTARSPNAGPAIRAVPRGKSLLPAALLSLMLRPPGIYPATARTPRPPPPPRVLDRCTSFCITNLLCLVSSSSPCL